MATSDMLKAVERIAHSAGEVILQVHAKCYTLKNDGSPVTEADKLADRLICDALQSLAPDIPIISEENRLSHQHIAGERFFLVDPLDGTKEFLRNDGQGAFTVNIGLIEHKQPILGVVYAPALGRMFSGAIDRGASEIIAGVHHSIAARKIPEHALVAVASRSHRDTITNDWLAHHNISQIVSTGSSLKFCLVACSEADVYPRFGPTMEWDTAAGHAVLSAAGGQVTTPEGHAFNYAKPGYRNQAFIAYGKGSLANAKKT